MNIRKIKYFFTRRINKYFIGPYLNYKHNRYEYNRFFKYSLAGLNHKDLKNLATQLKVYIHIIEKGFSFKNMKHGFGLEKLKYIVSLMQDYKKNGGIQYNEEIYIKGMGILALYSDYAKENNIDVSFIPKEFLKGSHLVGVERFSKKDDLQAMNFEEFARNRHSYRYFSSRTINDDVIKNAVNLAQTSPSACNRQSVKVYYTTQHEKCNNLLNVPVGAKGFENTRCVLIVTASLSSYTHINEYNTAYIDGGIFLMNLLYSLQYYGLASCPLLFDDNLSDGDKLREIIDIPKEEVVVGIIASGYYSDEPMKYSKSIRVPLDKILKKV